MYSKYTLYLILLFSSFFIYSCSDGKLSSSITPESSNNYLSESVKEALADVQNPISMDKVVKKREEYLSSLAQKVPGFAGYHLDRQSKPHVEDDKLVVLIKKEERKPSDITEVVSSFNKNFGDRIRRFNSKEVIVKEVKYSFRQLQAFRDVLHAPILSLEGVTMMDLAEDKNKILIGIENEEYRGSVEALIESLGIPSKAISVKIFERVKPSVGKISLSSSANPAMLTHETIRNYIRPLTGGLHISWYGGQNCTLGMIGKYATDDVFITNSHCSESPFMSGNDIYTQPSYPIGEELKDKEFTYYSPKDDYVRYSDAVIVELTDFVAEHGTVAYTNGRGYQWGDYTHQQIEIVHSSTPPSERLTYIGIEQTLINMPVVKTGRQTGTTVGYVDNTCTDVPVADGILLCQDIASPLYSDLGDSGSPVYTDYTSDVNAGEAKLIGILWGGNSYSSTYSPISGIRNDFQTVTKKLSFIPMEANISGENTIGSSGNYNYASDISNNSGSVTYQWSIKWEGSSSWNGLGTGSSQSISVSSDDNFTLKLAATDNTETSTVQFPVTVSFDCSPFNPCEN